MINKDAVFKSIFGNKWDKLPSVFHQRYSNRPNSTDKVIVKGKLNIYTSTWMKLLSPFLRLSGALVPYAGTNIPVTVRINSNPKSNTISFNREFNFPKKGIHYYRSKLVPAGGDQIIEFMRFGLGCQMRYYYDGEKVRLDHNRYIWRLFNLSIPLPFEYILGRAYASEKAISDKEFTMCIEIIHPLFDKIFGYEGKFSLWPL